MRTIGVALILLGSIASAQNDGNQIGGRAEPPAKPESWVPGLDWPQFLGGGTHTTFFERENRIRYPCVAWHFAEGRGQPTLRDGKLYCTGRKVYCLDASTGVLLGESPFEALLFLEAPAVARDRVIARTYDGIVYAFSRRLDRELWRWTPPERTRRRFSGVLIRDRYIVGHGPRLFALDIEDGLEVWCVEFKGDIEMVPAAADGNVYVGTAKREFASIRIADGHRDWLLKTDAPFGHKHPVVSGDRIYVTMDSSRKLKGQLRCIDAVKGETLWRAFAPGHLPSMLSVHPDRVLVGFRRSLFAYDRESGERVPGFEYEAAGCTYCLPTYVGDTLYHGIMPGHFVARNVETGQIRWRLALAEKNHACGFFYSGNRIFLATTQGIYALAQAEGREEAPEGFVLTPPSLPRPGETGSD